MKLGKRLTSLVLALVMVFSLINGASAATAENIKVQLSPNITVKLNGEAQTMADVNGNPVYPVLNGGTTYLPVRAVSGMLGISVDWDGATQTVLLDTSKKTTPTKTDAKAPASAKPTEITVQLSPNITVKLDGKVQTMVDVNSNPVYPLLYGGTTYLPIRAVSNMLGLGVDWDGATQTVLLGKSAPSSTTTPESKKKHVATVYDTNTIDIMLSVMESTAGITGLDEAEIVKALNETGIYENDRVIIKLDKNGGSNTTLLADNAEAFKRLETSTDAKTLGENHIGYDWAEIDWSNANDGYFRIKINEQTDYDANCALHWYKDKTESNEKHNHTQTYQFIPTGKWVNIPIEPKSGLDYVVTISKPVSKNSSETKMLTARFNGKPIDKDIRWTLSTLDVDYENAPKTCAKALEITKGCKTDAEKVTAVFNWVSSNIKYDYVLGNEIDAWNTERDNQLANGKTHNGYFKDGARKYLVLDDILASKKGVCRDYAVLMVGMLRSLGIPCKVTSGRAYMNGKWNHHAWVTISPDVKGLNMSALGAGKDFEIGLKNGELVNTNPTGWIRLDPTNAHIKAITSNDNNYWAEMYY